MPALAKSAPAAQLLTVEDAAQVLGISVRSVWKLLATDKIPAVKIGRCTRIRVGDLDRWMSSLPAAR